MAGTNRVAVLLSTYGGVLTKVVVCVAAAVVDPSGAVVAAIRAGIASVTTALGYKASVGVGQNISDTPANSDYEDIEDKAALTFSDVNGNHHTYYIPSPVSSMFDPTNNNDVNSSDADVAALISGMLTYVKTAGGDDLVRYVGGTRVRKKNRRR